MPTKLALGTQVAGRSGRQKLLTLAADAVAILDAHAAGAHKQGEFISRLLYEFEARREERIRLGRITPLADPDVSLVK